MQVGLGQTIAGDQFLLGSAKSGAFALGLFVAVTACSSGGSDAAPPPVAVQVLTLKAQPVPNMVELPGRISAVRTAEVRARTDGIVLRRLYEEGAMVKAGTPLFTIDPRDYRAQVQSAEAALQRAVAARENASSIVIRYGPLIDERAVSAQEYDAAQSDLRQANAQVAEARAALDRAKLLLDYTTVTAPIAGRAGAAQVTEGALVNGGEGTLMTRVDQVSPVYAVFAESSAAILNMIEEVRRGNLKLSRDYAFEVQLVMENGTIYGSPGRVDFASTVVDPETGSQTIRAQFPNPDGLLAPGQFVRGRIQAGVTPGGIVVPARAVQFQGEDASVSLLGKDGTVVNRPITLGALLGKSWVVKTGLKPGEQVIVDGWQKVRPGQKAQAVKAKANKSAPAQQQGR